jgi:hypothetical protein
MLPTDAKGISRVWLLYPALPRLRSRRTGELYTDLMDRDLATIGYCTNVHAGADWESTRINLERYALRVKQRVAAERPMGVGLWLSAVAAEKLETSGTVGEVASWLVNAGLIPFTFNGFPFGDFHQRVVKHAVYEPTWWDSSRLDYTMRLVRLQDSLLPPGMEGSISTLPIGWSKPEPTTQQWQDAARNLQSLADYLARIETERGRLIYVCLEPEPGCLLQRCSDVVELFERHLLPGGNERAIRRHLRVCHDICHSAVMFEHQEQALAAYHAAGIEVGKVQVSAAVSARFSDMTSIDCESARRQLASFNEPRYLHQTVVRDEKGYKFFEDLSLALDAVPAQGEWRTHFHVPIYLEKFGALSSTQSEIQACLRAIRSYSNVHHWEVETYAWGVLPDELKQPDLAKGIAEEMNWFLRQAIPA